MTVYSSAGLQIYIGGVMAQGDDLTLADFTTPPQTWVQIKEVEAAGSVGDTSEAITFTALDDSRTRTIKGPRSAGTMEIVCGIDPDDPGQQAVIAAEKEIHDYGFKLVFNDAPAGGTPSERYFIGKVMSQAEQYDQANNVMKLNISIGVNSNVVRVARAEATP
ncbi:phage tail tube protein [Neorhizobium sp. Rsf11]|uniref:Phage tail tube protein n=1 Tax=Neorhizobium phenanthreniclasticum TaxID=3157917 RepID=A0ABV0M1B6_9HYPH